MSSSPYSLGGNYTFNQASFGLPPLLPSIPSAANFTMPTLGASHFSPPSFTLAALPPPASAISSLPASHTSQSFGAIPATATALVKDHLPPEVKLVQTTASAYFAAKKIVDGSEQAIASGQSTAEAYTCQTVKVLTTELSGKVMKGAVISGTLPYLETCAAIPPLALSIPVVAAAIPEAYAGAARAAQSLGNGAETLCHGAFEQARKLAQEK